MTFPCLSVRHGFFAYVLLLKLTVKTLVQLDFTRCADTGKKRLGLNLFYLQVGEHNAYLYSTDNSLSNHFVRCEAEAKIFSKETNSYFLGHLVTSNLILFSIDFLLYNIF